MNAGDSPEHPLDRPTTDFVALPEPDGTPPRRAPRRFDPVPGLEPAPGDAGTAPGESEPAPGPDAATWAVLHEPEPEPDAEEGDATALRDRPAPVDDGTPPPALEIREPEAIVAGQNLHKQYGSGPSAVNALNGVSISLYPGSFTAIMGPSGSGKSTLMHLLAGLDTPTRGEVWIGPTRLGELGEADLTRLRRNRVGFVFQSFNLLPMLTLEQNITLPQRIAGREVDTEWLEWLLTAIALADRRNARPAELSGGEQQRVSLARALLGRPAVVFADEPTGNLDSRATEVILTMLRRAVADLGQTIVIVTHDPQAAARADRIVFLEDGRIVRET